MKALKNYITTYKVAFTNLVNNIGLNGSMSIFVWFADYITDIKACTKIANPNASKIELRGKTFKSLLCFLYLPLLVLAFIVGLLTYFINSYIPLLIALFLLAYLFFKYNHQKGNK